MKTSKYTEETMGFGVLTGTQHYFRVDVRKSKTTICEYFYSTETDMDTPRCTLDTEVFDIISKCASIDFNSRLKGKGLATYKFRKDVTVLDRMMGRELCLLAWAVEHADACEIETICKNWLALRPEERWWLYAITVAKCGMAHQKDRKSRQAVYLLLSDASN